jgi:hypothetical protein
MKHYRVKPIVEYGACEYRVEEWVWYWPIWWEVGDMAEFPTRKMAEQAIKHLKGEQQHD